MKIGIKEGDICNRDGCEGIMILNPVEDCYCHISPPCERCTSNYPQCDHCGLTEEDDR